MNPEEKSLSLRHVLLVGFKEGLPWETVVRDFNRLAVSSWPLVVPSMACLGVVLVAVAQMQASKLTGSLVVIGPAYLQLIVRELGPMAAALLCSARNGSQVASSLASKQLEEQVDALVLSGGTPLRDWVLPKIVASVAAVLFLSFLGTAAAVLSASWAASLNHPAAGAAFLNPSMLRGVDWLSALVKALGCGFLIPWLAARRGMSPKVFQEGVGYAVMTGVVDAAVACLFFDLLVAIVFYGLGW